VADEWRGDLDLVQRMLSGEEGAFTSFFNDYFPRVYRFALPRLSGDPDTGKEVAQATLVKAIRSLTQYRGEAALFTWVCQICRNEVIDHLRSRRQREQRVVSIEDSIRARSAFESTRAPALDEPMRHYTHEQMRQLVHDVLDGLPAHYGDVLEWKYIEGRSVAEIAALLGVGAAAAQSLLARARVAFRDALEGIAGADVAEILISMDASV